MTLTLEVIGDETPSGSDSRCSFGPEGGTIGRGLENTWVLSHQKVSGLHAHIRYRNGVFYIEDASRNGVALNDRNERLVKGREYALSPGDYIFLDPYEIHVVVARDQAAKAGRRPDDSFPWPSAKADLNPIDDDRPFDAPHRISRGSEGQEHSRRDLDPIEALGLGSEPRRRKGPSAEELDRGSPLDDHFQLPSVREDRAEPAPDVNQIPSNYDLLAPDSQIFKRTPAVPTPRGPTLPPVSERVRSDAPVSHTAPLASPPPTPVAPPPLPLNTPDPPPSRPQEVSKVARGEGGTRSDIEGLAALLAGAGLDPSLVTPELSRQIGEILRVVVSGVRDVLEARGELKDAFDMKRTSFRPVENNPLKFSANVDDALHNLLVKRNPAYLRPVEAFEDAFDDLRLHQLAMLAGMRVAFETLLATFDPDVLQQEFDRQAGKGLVPAKMRYWELYKERVQKILRDPDISFRRLFGEQFARAYTEQLKKLESGAESKDDTGVFRGQDRDDQ